MEYRESVTSDHEVTLTGPVGVYMRVRPTSPNVFWVENLQAGVKIKLGEEESFFDQTANKRRNFTLWADSGEREPQYVGSDAINNLR